MICTVTPITNSKQVENYYTRDDYYSRDAKLTDFWHGKLADKFSWRNKSVDKNHFAALIKLTSSREIAGNKKPTLGVDLTFSCPKSVSILQAVSPEYREIVNRCLAETTNEMIDFIEKNFVRTRRGHAGVFNLNIQKIFWLLLSITKLIAVTNLTDTLTFLFPI